MFFMVARDPEEVPAPRPPPDLVSVSFDATAFYVTFLPTSIWSCSSLRKFPERAGCLKNDWHIANIRIEKSSRNHCMKVLLYHITVKALLWNWKGSMCPPMAFVSHESRYKTDSCRFWYHGLFTSFRSVVLSLTASNVGRKVSYTMIFAFNYNWSLEVVHILHLHDLLVSRITLMGFPVIQNLLQKLIMNAPHSLVIEALWKIYNYVYWLEKAFWIQMKKADSPFLLSIVE